MLDLLTSEIDAMPDPDKYDELTNRIHREAVRAGVEPKLRAFLEERGMLGENDWNGSSLR